MRVWYSILTAVSLRLTTTSATTTTSDHMRRTVTWHHRRRRHSEACMQTPAMTTDRPHCSTQRRRTRAACRLTATASRRDAQSSRNQRRITRTPQHTTMRRRRSWGGRLWVPAAAAAAAAKVSVDSSWSPRNEFYRSTPAPAIINVVVPPPPTPNESRSVSSDSGLTTHATRLFVGAQKVFSDLIGVFKGWSLQPFIADVNQQLGRPSNVQPVYMTTPISVPIERALEARVSHLRYI